MNGNVCSNKMYWAAYELHVHSFTCCDQRGKINYLIFHNFTHLLNNFHLSEVA